MESEASLGHRLIEALRVQHRADPDLGLTRRPLADLCESSGQWAEAVTLLEELAEMEGDEEESPPWCSASRTPRTSTFDDPERAWKALLPQVQGGDIACLDLITMSTLGGGCTSRCSRC